MIVTFEKEYLCDLYEKGKIDDKKHPYSNNSAPEFTDAELMTNYIFVITGQKYFQVKQIYRFAKEYMHSRFPKLPSYQAFNNRINRLPEAFKTLSAGLFTGFIPKDCDMETSLTDSMPVVACKGKNKKAKVATEVVDKGWCSTKNIYQTDFWRPAVQQKDFWR